MRRSRSWHKGLLLLLPILLGGCANPFLGLDERMRRMRGSLDGLPTAAQGELRRTHAAFASAGRVVETIPLREVPGVFGQVAALGQGEIDRPHQAIQGLLAFQEELGRPIRILHPGGLLPGHFGQEGARTRAALDGVERLVQQEFERRMLRDPRRVSVLIEPEETGILPRPLSYPRALFRSLPIW